jgi:hypothetical protein
MPGRAFCHNAKKNKRHEEAGPAAEDLPGLSAAIYVAEEVGKGVGRGPLLQRTLSSAKEGSGRNIKRKDSRLCALYF